jgi:hypothetical protein
MQAEEEEVAAQLVLDADLNGDKADYNEDSELEYVPDSEGIFS